MLWNFYNSNILSARFWVESEIHYSQLDPATGVFSPPVPLTQADGEAFQVRWGMNPLQAFHSLPALEEALGNNSTGGFTLEDGRRYTPRGDGTYAQRQVVGPMDLLCLDGSPAAFLWPSRDLMRVLVRDGMEDATILGQWSGYQREGLYPVEALPTQMAPMGDGIQLATDVYLPKGAPQPLPAILVRTPYGVKNNAENYFRYVQRGYAVVLQDVRGREDSQGEFLPCHGETEDGDDALNWIAAQPWSNGRVGMMGGSYLGYTQWAAAASGNPHLKAMISMVTAGSAFVDIPRRGGCMTSGMLAWSFALSDRRMRADRMVRDDWDEVLDIRPLADIPRKALGQDIPFLTQWLNHTDEDEFWLRGDWHRRMLERGNPAIPTLLVSGWFDDNGMGSTQALDLMRHWPAGTSKVILGPWVHGFNTRYDIHDISVGAQALRYDIDLLFLRWLDQHLKEIPSAAMDGPGVEYYTLGQHRWRTADQWPIPGCEERALYLAAGNQLLPEPGELGSAQYRYDPADPATHIVDMSENELEVPADYTEEEKREDVLLFTTPPLKEPLTVTGDILVRLYISSSAPDTDFVVRVTEVTPDGRSIKLADGMLGAKYRDGFAAPHWLEQGEIYKLEIRTTKLSKTFPAGSCIRFTATSSAKNFTFPNSNTKQGFDSQVIEVAENVIHFGGDTPSCILLPVEP